jgi:hypothetical protein
VRGSLQIAADTYRPHRELANQLGNERVVRTVMAQALTHRTLAVEAQARDNALQTHDSLRSLRDASANLRRSTRVLIDSTNDLNTLLNAAHRSAFSGRDRPAH